MLSAADLAELCKEVPHSANDPVHRLVADLPDISKQLMLRHHMRMHQIDRIWLFDIIHIVDNQIRLRICR